MTNKELQKRLNKKKWLESEKVGEDMGGQMDYCSFCLEQDLNGYCGSIQDEIDENCLCAKAYLRSKRKEKVKFADNY